MASSDFIVFLLMPWPHDGRKTGGAAGSAAGLGAAAGLAAGGTGSAADTGVGLAAGLAAEEFFLAGAAALVLFTAERDTVPRGGSGRLSGGQPSIVCAPCSGGDRVKSISSAMRVRA